ncbi:hypothetical protein B0T25DRAFT_551256 [Lasiosphaeria hispida]|uniref:Uncharacterized protein n=1 Tax=Lasiosphaeria hispida TaxID=260671 RepID=A0AAJ0HAR2_9PEZI|nr:hypothetical protein B0T25DRAFT_551256 [Lasiosphaeria hispida]
MSQAAQERRRNEKATLEEYLQHCYTLIYTRLMLAYRSKSTIGMTKVDGKYYPKWLCPRNHFWNDERRRVILIDFDRADPLPMLKHKQFSSCRDLGGRGSRGSRGCVMGGNRK